MNFLPLEPALIDLAPIDLLGNIVAVRSWSLHFLRNKQSSRMKPLSLGGPNNRARLPETTGSPPAAAL